MKFTNVSDDARNIPSLGITVESGATTPDLSPDEAASFSGQTEVWQVVGKTPVASAPAEVTAAPVADEGKP